MQIIIYFTTFFYFIPLEIKTLELLRCFIKTDGRWLFCSPDKSDIPVLTWAFFFEADEKTATFKQKWKWRCSTFETLESYFPSLPGIGWPYLPLCEVQVDGDLVATEPGQVVVVGELGLQLPQLLLGERRALFPGLAAGVHLKTGLLDICRETETKKCFAFLGKLFHHVCLTNMRKIKCFFKWAYDAFSSSTLCYKVS